MLDESNVVTESKSKSIIPWVVTILIAAWLVGMSIVAAGYLISKEIANQSASPNPIAEQTQGLKGPLELSFTENQPLIGSVDAKVTVVEFADYQCPYCGQWHKEIYSKLKSEYIDSGKVKFYFWDFAFLGEESFVAAEAAMCAKEQGKYWEYHSKLFSSQEGENQNVFSTDNLKKMALELGLDKGQFDTCVDSRRNKGVVEESTNKASGYGILSTPTVSINGVPFEGVLPWDSYKQVIEEELAK